MSVQTNKLARRSTIAVGFVCGILILLSSYSIPQNKWDMLGHLGGALHFSMEEPEDILEKTYSIARQTLPASAMDELLNAYPERKIWSTNADSFFQLLPFYEPRVLVTYPTHLAYQAGINPISYLRFQSSIAAGLGVLLFAVFLAGRVDASVLVLFPVICLVAGVLEVARFEGADALAFLAFALAMLLAPQKSLWALLVLALLPLTRSDLAIFSIPALLYCFYIYSARRGFVLSAFILCLASYFGINHIFGNYGWSKQFYVAQIEYLTHPADKDITINFSQYISALMRGSVKLIYNYQFHIFVLAYSVSVAAYCKTISREGWRVALGNVPLTFSILSGVFVALHFIVFPSMHTRYFAGQYLFVLLIAMILIQSWCVGEKSDLTS